MQGRTILLVGGAASKLCLAAGLARELNAVIELASDREEATAALHRLRPDLVLVEVSCDVGEIVQLLQAERVTVPVLACGIGARAELAVAAVLAGARDYIPLPLSRDAVAAVFADDPRAAAASPPVNGLVGRKMDDVERALILQTLQRCKGNRTTASQLLGISVRTMRNKLRAFIDDGVAVPPAA